MKTMTSEQIFRIAMRDMKREGMNTEVISVREFEARVRPNELSDKLVNGQAYFNRWLVLWHIILFLYKWGVFTVRRYMNCRIYA